MQGRGTSSAAAAAAAGSAAGAICFAPRCEHGASAAAVAPRASAAPAAARFGAGWHGGWPAAGRLQRAAAPEPITGGGSRCPHQSLVVAAAGAAAAPTNRWLEQPLGRPLGQPLGQPPLGQRMVPGVSVDQAPRAVTAESCRCRDNNLIRKRAGPQVGKRLTKTCPKVAKSCQNEHRTV